MKVPASSPVLSEQDKEILHKVVEDGFYTEWKQCNKFKRQFSKVNQSKHTILTNSGSSANLVAIATLLDLFPGKYVITTATGFPTTVAPVYQHGAIPIYIDVDYKTLSPDIGQFTYVMDKWGDQVAGAVFAHTLGFPFDERLIREILGDKWLVADCCDALGGAIRGKPVGYLADIATHSFFPAHHIFGIQGGALTTNDDRIVKVANQYIRWGKDCWCLPGQDNVCGKRLGYAWDKLPDGYDHKYVFTKLGYNLQSNEFSGALLNSQLERLPEFVMQRKKNWFYLFDKLLGLDGYLEFTDIKHQISPFGFLITVRDSIKTLTNSLIQHLENNGVATRRVFGGNLTLQPAFKDLPYVQVPDLDGSNKLLEQSFWVGVWPGLDETHMKYIADTITAFFNERGLY